MLENIDQIISGFQTRVDALQADWNTLCEGATLNKCQSINEQMYMLKSKLHIIQQQNTGIIVDLGIIKTHLLTKNQDNNNVFLTEEQAELLQNAKENDEPVLEEEAEAQVELSPAPQVFKELFDNEVLYTSLKRENENLSMNELPQKFKVMKNQYLNKRKALSPRDMSNIDNYQLVMSDCPKTVQDLYQEFYTDTKLQILHFEEKYGVGQLSKLPKLRTYQRRSALVNAINKYSKGKNISIEHAIEHFQSIVDENDKTIPWLYNNLAKILEQYHLVQ